MSPNFPAAPNETPRPHPIFFICQPPPPPSGKHRPARQGLPAPSNFPTLPTTYCPIRVTPSFYSRPTAPYPAEKHRPTRWPPRAPKLSHPSHHLLPDPIGPLFLCPVQAPPPLSGKHRPARQGLPAPSNFPTLPTTYCPTRATSSFYVPPNPPFFITYPPDVPQSVAAKRKIAPRPAGNIVRARTSSVSLPPQ